MTCLSSRACWRSLVPILPGCLILCLAASIAPHALASVPTETPVFSNPLNITNEYTPFVKDAVKAYRGKADGERFVAIHINLPETRSFLWNGTMIETHTVKEMDFLSGTLVEVSLEYYAQSDDGTVYHFGEVVDMLQGGKVVSHEGSWLVGGPTLPSDPAETAQANNPTISMPANPEEGDQFKPEDVHPIVDEEVTVLQVGKKIKVEAGKFKKVMKVKEVSEVPQHEVERKWYAAGVGVIRTRSEDERLELISTTFPVAQKPK